MWRAAVLLALVTASVATPAQAHGPSHALEELLQGAGEGLMLGDELAAQTGPLVLVPRLEGSLPCPLTLSGAAVPLGANATVSIVSNATHVAFGFDVEGEGFVGVGLDQGYQIRTLLMMMEYAMRIHAFAGVASRGPILESGYGVLGMPHALPQPENYSHPDMGPLEGGGVRMEYHEPGSAANGLQMCPESSRGHVTILAERATHATTLAEGRLAHVVLLHDPELPHLLPRPIDESTTVVQLNLYLLRDGERLEEVREAMDGVPPRFDVAGVAVALLASGFSAREAMRRK